MTDDLKALKGLSEVINLREAIWKNINRVAWVAMKDEFERELFKAMTKPSPDGDQQP